MTHEEMMLVLLVRQCERISSNDYGPGWDLQDLRILDESLTKRDSYYRGDYLQELPEDPCP